MSPVIDNPNFFVSAKNLCAGPAELRHGEVMFDIIGVRNFSLKWVMLFVTNICLVNGT
jgi:hypothetical protein